LSLTEFYSSPHLQRYSHIPEPATIINNEFGHNLTYNRRLLIPKTGRHDLKRQRVETSHTGVENPIFARESPTPDPEHTSSRHAYDSSDRAVTMRKPKVDLNPCHICRRKPTIKSELDAFADCEACSERTCYICIRECLGLGVEDPGETEEDSDVLHLPFRETEDGMDLGGTGTFDQASPDEDLRFEGNLGVGRGWEKTKTRAHRRMICSRCCVERGTEGEVWCFGCLGTEGPG
jgi:hypothetical protein